MSIKDGYHKEKSKLEETEGKLGELGKKIDQNLGEEQIVVPLPKLWELDMYRIPASNVEEIKSVLLETSKTFYDLNGTGSSFTIYDSVMSLFREIDPSFSGEGPQSELICSNAFATAKIFSDQTSSLWIACSDHCVCVYFFSISDQADDERLFSSPENNIMEEDS